MKKIDSKKTGFTLVEVMVAVTIGGFIMLVAVGTLKAITSSAEMVDTNISAAAEVRFAMNLIARDLVNFYRDENNENTKLIGITEESSDGNVSFMVFYTVNRMKARADQAEGDIYEVEYSLRKDGEKSLLMRRLWPNPNEEYEPGGILAVIAEDIDVFEVRYFDGEEWSDEWPEEMRGLPQLIEVSIVGKPQSRGTPSMESIMVNLTRSVTATVAASESSEGGGGGGTPAGGGGSAPAGGGGSAPTDGGGGAPTGGRG
ncbi:MAG: type II secretion system protein GspJ [Planctomycetota bacterium]